MKKILVLLLILISVVTSFTACKIHSGTEGEGTGGNENGDQKPGGDDEKPSDESGVIFSPDKAVSIVRSEENSKLDIGSIFDAVYAALGADRIPMVNLDTTQKSGGEIVLGETSREISKKAKAMLDEKMSLMRNEWEEEEKSTTFLFGFAFYSDGESLALVWSDDRAYSYAAEYLINNYLVGSTLELEDGYFKSELFDYIEVLREEEDAVREEVYVQIAEKNGADVADALKKHMSLFDKRFYLWIADLYDPGEYDEDGNPLGGGFYYSNSGRDTPGYDIDIESTAQALGMVMSSWGFFDNANAHEVLPESMFREIATFVLSCQSSTDGYFYHPQWGTNVKTSRIGRDLSNAVSILTRCGVIPYWNTPAGDDGYYGEPDGDETKKKILINDYIALLNGGTLPASALTGRLSDSSFTFVSKLLPTAEGKKWNGSVQLATLENWENYILGFKDTIRTASYSIGNTFESQSKQILSRDKLAIDNGELPDKRDIYGNSGSDGFADGGYVEMWKNYFDLWQLDNGLWEECSVKDGTVYYNAINGLMKISSTYNRLQIPLNRIPEAFECAMFMVTYFGNDGATGDDEKDWADSKGKAPTGIVDVFNPWVTMNTLASMSNRDGDKETAEAIKATVRENAVKLLTATTTKVSKFGKEDGSYGYNWLYSPANSQGAPVAVPKSVEGDVNGGMIAFTGILGHITSLLGITSRLKPFAYSDALVFAERIKELSPVIKDDVKPVWGLDGDYNFNEDEAGENEPMNVSLSFSNGFVEVQEDTNDGDNRFLMFVGNPGTGVNSISFKPKTLTDATAIVFEWRMKFDEIVCDNNTVFQITLGSEYMLAVGVSTDGTFTLGDSSSTGSPRIAQTFNGKFDAYEWNKIRLEHYVIDEDSRTTVTFIYVNDVLKFVSNNYYGKEKESSPSLTYTNVSFRSLMAADVVVYLDDVKATHINTPYVDKSPADPNRIKDFDSVTAGSGMLPSGVSTSDGIIVHSPTAENENNNIFVLNKKNAAVSIKTSSASSIPNCYSASLKMKIDATSAGEVGHIALCGANASKIILAYTITVYTENGEKLAKLTEFNKDGEEHKSYLGLPVGAWFTLGIEFYPKFYSSESSSILYLDGEELGRGSCYYYIGTLSADYAMLGIEMTSDHSISIDDVISEKIYKKFVGKDGSIIDDPKVEIPTSGKSSSTPAGENHNGRFDFEGVELGTPKVPGLNTSVNVNEYGYWLDIVKDPADAANQVLSHKVAPSTSVGNTASYTASKISPDGANCYVFSFDVYIGGGTAGEIQTSMVGAIGGTTRSMFQTNMVFRGKDGVGTLEIKTKRDNSSSLSSVDGTGSADVSIGNTKIIGATSVSGWVNVRFELYTDEGIVKIYYDGDYRAETDAVYTNQMSAEYSSASMYSTWGSNLDLYFDNVVVEKTLKEYTKETCSNPTAPAGNGSGSGGDEGEGGDNTDTPATPAIKGRYDFNSAKEGAVSLTGIQTSLNGGGHAKIASDTSEATNKVLEFNTQGGSGSSYNEHVSFDVSTSSSAKYYAFEWRMKFESIETNGQLVQLNFGSAYLVTINYNKANETYTIGDMSSYSSSSAWFHSQNALSPDLTAFDWHRFRIEYAVIDGRAMIKLYVNSSLVAVSDNHFGESAVSPSSVSSFTKARFRSNQSSEFTVLLDDVAMYASETPFVTDEYTHEVNAK